MAASSPNTPNLRFLLPKNRWTVVALVLALMAGASALHRWLQGRTEVVTIHVNDIPLTVEVANNPVSRPRGLQEREKLASDAGMLFMFPEPQILKFWMKDTPIDLDIGFFDSEGRLINTATMTALDSKTQHASTGLAQYALEVNQGWFARHGIAEGALLHLPSVMDAR
jgi:uncharacterized protein